MKSLICCIPNDISSQKEEGPSPAPTGSNSELEAVRETLLQLRSQRAFVGLSDLIDWVDAFSADEKNDFGGIIDFIKLLVPNKLYVEKYLQLWT